MPFTVLLSLFMDNNEVQPYVLAVSISDFLVLTMVFTPVNRGVDGGTIVKVVSCRLGLNASHGFCLMIEPPDASGVMDCAV
jgi:hypothetical protein